MSLEKLLAKIEEDARGEGVSIASEAKQEVERIKERGVAEARLVAEGIRKNFREKADRERVKIMSEALSESRLSFLSVRERLFDEVINEVAKDVVDMPEERYRGWLRRNILTNATSGDEQILAASYDWDLLAGGLLDEINGAFREEGRTGALTLADDRADFNRGVIIQGDKVKYNLSLEAVLRDLSERYEEEVLKILHDSVESRGGA